MPLKKQYPWNVLVFPAASEIGLEIHRALRDCKEVVLYGINQPDHNIAEYVFKRLHTIPSIYKPDCFERLQRLIEECSIDAIFPAHDDVGLWLAAHAEKLSTTIITSPIATVDMCRSKRATYETLKDFISTPQLWDINDKVSFPVFVKPDRGQGSQRARRIDDRRSLDDALRCEKDLLIMENLTGCEYTIDCFSAEGKVIYTSARIRKQTKTGIATLCHMAHLPQADTWAKRIANRLDLRGAWFFQMKENTEGKAYLLEVAPRMAGSMALSRTAGPNFPLLSLYEAAGHSIKITSFLSDIRMGRSLDIKFIYDRPIDALYLDFDDTLIVHGEVNTRMIALLFQCRNRGIPVYLLTHHPGNLEEALASFRLAELFDRIIHVPDPSTPKAKFIIEKNAVLIDDSFHERITAEKMHGIRCFDAAAAACLIDERS